MVTVLMGLRSVRNVLDRFCMEQGLRIDSPAAFNAARHCMVLVSEREFDEGGLLLQLRDWYKSSQTLGQVPLTPPPARRIRPS